MYIQVKEVGEKSRPLLLCLPGLHGSSDDFTKMIQGLEEHFNILLVDFFEEEHDVAYKQNAIGTNYFEYARKVYEYLDQTHPSKGVFLAAYSIGGKVAYHLIANYPEIFLGGFLTDISPGRLDETELFKVLDVQTKALNLSQDWQGIKRDLKHMIDDRYLLSFVKSQISFPKHGQQAVWKPTMRNLEVALKDEVAEDLWTQLKKVESYLVAQRRKLVIVKTDKFSGITDEDEAKVRQLRFVEMSYIPNASHFVHVSHVDELRQTVLAFSSQEFS